MVRLYDEALRPIVDDEKFKRMQMYEDMDAILLHKWCDVVTRLMPPAATRSSRFSFAASKSRREVAYTQYTTRQLEYIGLLLKSMLNVKQSTMQVNYWQQIFICIQYILCVIHICFNVNVCTIIVCMCMYVRIVPSVDRGRRSVIVAREPTGGCNIFAGDNYRTGP